MSAGRGDLERALGVSLPVDVGEIELVVDPGGNAVGPGANAAGTSPLSKPTASRSVAAASTPRFDTAVASRVILVGHQQRADAPPAAGQADGQRPAHGLDLTVERELADDRE